MIVRAGILYDGTLEPPRHNVDIVIEDGVIRELRDASGDCEFEAPCVTPGLVNAHVHLEMSGEADTMSMFRATTATQRAFTAAENARKSLEGGVTTVRDVGASNNIAIDLRDAVARGALPGPRIRAAGQVLCMTGGHGWFVGRFVDSPDEARKAVREQLWQGADCIKMIATGGVLTKGAVPGLAQLTHDEMEAACIEAHRHNMKICAHAIGTDGIKNALRAGVDSIEHGHILDHEAIELFKQYGTYLVPTLTAPTCILENAERGAQPEFVVRKARDVNEAMLVNIRRAYESGVKVAGGSDAGTPFNYHDNYVYEVELMQRMLGMSPQQALNAATQVAAELIGLHRGVLAAGEPADLLLLERDIAGNIGALRHRRGVFKDGAAVA